MRTIAVVTVARSDYGIWLPVLKRIQSTPSLKLSLLVTGMHLAPAFGLTVRTVEADGFDIEERIDMLIAGDTPVAISKSMGVGVMGFAGCFARFRPDILMVLGDRFETITAALAALPFKIPVAHLHGGEVTEGAIDDALRHAITKLSHLHFVSTDAYARRVIQMGEEPWRVTVSGAPSLDNLNTIELLDAPALEARVGMPLAQPFLLVTYHPVTLEYEQTAWQIGELLAVLDRVGLPVVFTLPNADTGGQAIIDAIRVYVDAHADARMVDNLGTKAYFSLMRFAAAMVGNSSSGILEAASLRLPVVNIGNRQRGRDHAENVLDVGYEQAAIVAGIQKATNPAFRAGLAALVNPYGDGQAAAQIVERLETVALDERLITKRFHDLPA